MAFRTAFGGRFCGSTATRVEILLCQKALAVAFTRGELCDRLQPDLVKAQARIGSGVNVSIAEQNRSGSRIVHEADVPVQVGI